jgi:hypothetical protein
VGAFFFFVVVDFHVSGTKPWSSWLPMMKEQSSKEPWGRDNIVAFTFLMEGDCSNQQVLNYEGGDMKRPW